MTKDILSKNVSRSPRPEEREFPPYRGVVSRLAWSEIQPVLTLGNRLAFLLRVGPGALACPHCSIRLRERIPYYSTSIGAFRDGMLS